MIQFQCPSCKVVLKVADEKAGRRGKCPSCGGAIAVPAAPAPAPVATSQPIVESALPTPLWAARPRGRWTDRLYLLLLLASVPLLLHTWLASDDTETRLEHTLAANPAVSQKLQEGASLDEVLGTLPDRRIDGAAFPRDTRVHWLFAALSAAFFFALALAVLRSKDTRPRPMLFVGLFTGTLGILLLLGFQYVADWTQGLWLTGRSILIVLFYIVKFIGFSYRAADDPSNGFLLSFLGFTCGVGFCEELCKALPLLWHFKTEGTLGWRGACVWGLVSGAGFGVAEGIMYSSRYYNGVQTGGIYWVRFLSCVSLHTVWAAAVGVSLCRHRERIQGLYKTYWEIMGWMIYIMAVPMVLHGLFDTLLKLDYQGWALATVSASFGWLAYQIEMVLRQERAAEAMARS